MSEKNPKPDWRQANKPASGGSPAAGGGKRDWQKQAVADKGPRKPWSRGSKLALAVGLLSLFVGGVYVVIEWIRPVRPACLVLMGASYDTNLAIPENVYGWRNLDDLSKLKEEADLFTEEGKINLLYRSRELKGADAWKKEWNSFVRDIREKTVVVFLSLHGAADSKEPYFFLDDDNGYARLPFSEVLKSLESIDKNVVLIVEPAQRRANWSAGVLENNFVAKLLELKGKLKPNVFIICASDQHQISWPSEEWQQTAFGHFVVEGLRGAAAPDAQDRITIARLFDYVHREVVAWSQANRGIEQTPIFIGDENQAAHIELAQIATAYKKRETPETIFTVPEPLETAWKGWQSLRTMTPHPAVYSPALWRRYQDMLVRYEQLVRAGDPTKQAGEVANKLAAMKKKLEGEARFETGEQIVALDLPLPEALGIPLPLPQPEVEKWIERIWAAKDEQRPELVKDMIDWSKKQGDVTASQTSVQANRALLKFLDKSQQVRDSDLVGRQTSKTQAILETLGLKLNAPRPAEVHFLTMLLKDVSRDPVPDLDLLRKSLVVRQLAERAALAVPDVGTAHPYSEVVLPWNRELVAKADARRRPGEDYLFGSTALDWQKASAFLDQAKKTYLSAQEASKDYRAALDCRDKAFAELPYYAAWVANQRVSSDKGHEERVDDWSKKVAALASQAESLHAELCKDKGFPSPTVLHELVDLVTESLVKLQTDLGGEIVYANQDTHSHSLWLVREAILSVPPLLPDQAGADAVDVRFDLLKYNRATTNEFHKKGTPVKGFGGTAQRDAEISAKRNARMAVAAFKNFWPAEFARVENQTPLLVGEALAPIMKDWPLAINKASSESLRESNLNAARLTLRQADFLARGLPGGFFDERAESVSQALRSLRMADLFLVQAQRTEMDHWFSEAGDVPYYATAAQSYLKAARGLVEVKGDARDVNKQRLAELDKASPSLKTVGLKINGAATGAWTSEKAFPVRWTIETPNDPYLTAGDADPKLPPAVAVTWRELEGPGAWKDAAASQDPPPTGQRRPMELVPRTQREFEDQYYLTKPNADDAPLKATYHALLRGDRQSFKTDISRKDPDLVVHDFPRPSRSFVKVRMAEKFTYGAISIAFDMSGSMFWKENMIDTPQGKKTRMELALRALETTLKMIPEKTHVSVIAFVAAGDKAKPVIKDVRKPTHWEGERSVNEVIVQLKELAENASQNGSTPLALTLRTCLDRGFPAVGIPIEGPKVILGLTDGDDTSTFELLGEAAPPVPSPAYNKKVANYVNDNLNNKDVEIHLVAFIDPEKSAKDAANADAQFGGVRNFRPEGRLIFQPDPAQLAKELQMAIRPRLRLLQRSDPPPGYPKDGEFASLWGDDFNWREVPEGEYEISVKGSPQRTLSVKAGDMIALVLKRDPNDPRRIVYEREMYADFTEAVPLLGDTTAMQGRYRVAVLQNQGTAKSNLLTQLVDVEEVSKSGARIQQSTPYFTWIESKPKSQASPRMTRWYREYGYPALTFRLHGYDWPFQGAVPSSPEVKVWLTDNSRSDKFAKSLKRPRQKNEVDVVRLNDQEATIESALIEDKEVVPDRSGKVGSRLEPRQCLVVRVNHPKGKPVFVQFDGEHKGEEHHYFDSADKYTAMFWDFDPNQTSFAFNVIFLDALKREAPAALVISGRNSNLRPPYDKMGN